MNQTSKKTIEAVLEKYDFDNFALWTVLKDAPYYIKLHAGINDEEIGLVMFGACHHSIKETASETLKEFVSNKGFVLEGGLLYRENDEIKVAPGCCCGLENWYEWLEVPNGRVNIWTGHDPESLIEINDGKIKIWQDSEKKDENKSIEFTVEEMIEKLQNVEKDMKDFLFRLGQWTKYIAPELEKRVVNHFAKNMNIKL